MEEIIASELLVYLIAGVFMVVLFLIGKSFEFIHLVYHLYIKDMININERLKQKLRDKNKKL